jgi:Tfp pilus assembly PilM family ATPase
VIQRIFRRRQPYVCIDFGRDRLSAVEVVDGTVTRWVSRPLAPDALRNGAPADPGWLGGAVRHALDRTGIQARQVRFAVPDEATVSRLLELPLMPRWDLSRAMHYQAERHVPFPIDRARWSWDVVERRRDGLTVYLVATWRDVIDQYADVARTARLFPEVLEPRAIAVARALGQDLAVLIDAGPRRLHITLVVGGQPTFVDEAVVGEGGADRQEVVDRLLQRAYRHQSTATEQSRRMAPVLVAGDLGVSDLRLPVAGTPVAEVLNGQLPMTPPAFQSAAYLANVGLAMRAFRWQ